MPRLSRFAPDRLRATRLRANLGAVELSKLIPVDNTTYYEWERGVKVPALDSYLRLIAALGCDFDALLNDHEVPLSTSRPTMKRSVQDENA